MVLFHLLFVSRPILLVLAFSVTCPSSCRSQTLSHFTKIYMQDSKRSISNRFIKSNGLGVPTKY